MSVAEMKLIGIVAHPDDEAVWCGGILGLLRTKYRLHIVSATHAGNPAREKEFRLACRLLTAEPYLLDCKDGGNEGLPCIIPRLDSLLAVNAIAPDTIAGVVTHSPAGEEHWHVQHIELHWQIAAWTRRIGLDFSFFSAHPGVSAFSPLFSRREALVSLWRLQSKNNFLRDCFRIARALWDYRLHENLKVAIAGDFKKELLSVYDAQSLRGYAAYSSPFEYIFTKNPGIVDLLKVG